MQQNTTQGLPDTLATELFTRCLHSDGTGFTICRYLGTYRQHFVRTESGWQCDRNPDTAPILHLTEQVRQFVAQFPALSATYPHKVTQDERSITPLEETWVISEAQAVITVPDGFVQKYDGSQYLEQLMQEQPAAIAALAEDIKQRLLRYEIRTAQMFSQYDTHLHICFAVQQDAVFTDIWHLPLEKYNIAPLFTEDAQCAVARATASALAELLHCEATICCTVTQGFHRAYTVQLTIKDTPS